MKPLGDFLVAQILTDQVQDLDFPLGQGGVVESEGGPFLDIREQMLSCHGPEDAVYEPVRGAFFVNEAVRSGLPGQFHKMHILEPGHDNDFDLGKMLPYLPGVLDPAGFPFHADIHEYHLGVQSGTGRLHHF